MRVRTLLTTTLLAAAALIPLSPAPALADSVTCDRQVCPHLFGSGRHVDKATIQLLGALDGVRVTFHYYGNDDHGTAGPDKTTTKTCSSGCAAQWAINFTYSTSAQVCGSVIKSGVVEGRPCKSF